MKASTSPRTRGFAAARAAARDQRGVAAIEFALIVPVMLLIMAGMIDIGASLYTRFQLTAAVAAAANSALVQAASVNSTSGPGLAGSLATIASTAQGASVVSSTVTVNNGPIGTASNGSSRVGGTATGADACYCPSGAAPVIAWGLAKTCAAACPGGGYAGKFVVVTASRPFQPLFLSFGIVSAGTVTISSIVQVQ